MKTTTIATTLCALFALGTGGRGEAQERPTMGPLQDYLMDEAYEVALARSAAPTAVGSEASVLILTEEGYREARRGGNGFTCLVERSWSSPFGPHDDFYNPRLRAPICYNAAAARANLLEYLRRTELALAGKGWEEVRDGVAVEIADGTIRPAEGLAMAYMLSDQQLLGTRTGRFIPHLMLYVPFATREDYGGSEENRRLMVFEYEGGPMASLILPADAWVEGPSGGR